MLDNVRRTKSLLKKKVKSFLNKRQKPTLEQLHDLRLLMWNGVDWSHELDEKYDKWVSRLTRSDVEIALSVFGKDETEEYKQKIAKRFWQLMGD